MKQQITVHRVRDGAREYRVLRAAAGPGRLALRDEHHWLTLYADRAGLERLLAVWALATRSPHSLLHLPLRAQAPPAGLPPLRDGAAAPETLDLVLAHHSLQFRPSAWKDLRSRLGRGRPQTTGTPDADFRAVPGFVERLFHREFRDHLRFDLAARTLFVTGSAAAFRDDGRHLAALRTEGPADHHRRASRTIGHECAEIGTAPRSFPTTRGPFPPGLLHVQYCPDWAE
ncbi:hypothetical protein ACIQBJ_02710 [Kitasatospora sp. NPDC088391]|uniref:hypothetical protein n=1 Tax=Kitasatospora sp. NPDC088391 TaxID=3364074 RepID=UPI0037F2F90D